VSEPRLVPRLVWFGYRFGLGKYWYLALKEQPWRLFWPLYVPGTRHHSGIKAQMHVVRDRARTDRTNLGHVDLWLSHRNRLWSENGHRNPTNAFLRRVRCGLAVDNALVASDRTMSVLSTRHSPVLGNASYPPPAGMAIAISNSISQSAGFIPRQ
jgi:hypothetical protein